MELGETLHLTTRKAWRSWLKAHYRSKDEIWLVYNKKETGKPRVAYNDAVEEALCFGWIDSTAKKLDEGSFAQRFSPRKPGSAYSQANKERLRALAAEGLLMPEVRERVGDILDEEFEVPPDILKAVRANQQAWENYQNFSDSYKRIRVAFIDGARKRPEEFQKRLRYFIKMTEQNKMFGFGGIEKHY
jgi:uncharacterized protein YdeI (YjbR/CyaY-like superfamily)